MKNFKFLFFFLSLLFLYSCSKEEPLSISPNTVDTASLRGDKTDAKSRLNDTTDWDLTFLFDLMAKEMDGDMMLNFINTFGYPHANKGFRKRGENVNITSIPTIKEGSITGIIKVMVKPDGVDAIYFFPLKEIETAISKEYLETEDYHLYRGAVQSLIICAKGMKATLDGKYMDWLKKNSNRAKERSEWNCIEIYGDCFLEPIACFNCPNPYNQPLNCELLYQECWKDEPYGAISGSVNWGPTVNSPNTTDPNTNDPTNGGSSSGPNVNEDFYAEKAAFLEKWLEDNNLDNDLFDALYLCVYHMYVEGFGLVEPTGIAASCVEENMPLPSEEQVISVLMERFGWDANHPNVIFLISNPSYLNFILDADVEFTTEFTNLML